jgi:hypothetical protein
MKTTKKIGRPPLPGVWIKREVRIPVKLNRRLEAAAGRRKLSISPMLADVLVRGLADLENDEAYEKGMLK